MNRIPWLLATAALVFWSGCSDDDNSTGSDGSNTRNIQVQIINQSDTFKVLASDTFGTQPIPPGQAITFEFEAPEGSRLSFATMFGQSNDWFFAPDPNGIALYDDQGEPLNSVDITDQIYLWDAGTELDEPIGTGANQAPRQSGPNSGPADTIATIRKVNNSQYSTSNVMQATIRSSGSNHFSVTLRVKPTSPTAISPGVYAVHKEASPIFVPGDSAANGLEAQAEDGNPVPLSNYLDKVTGVSTAFSRGLWVISNNDSLLFVSGDSASSALERLAEDGNPSSLISSLEQRGITANSFNSIAPGDTLSFSTEINPGDRLYFATMLVESNDLFFAPDQGGILLWPEVGQITTGNVTDSVQIWNAGTEEDQEIGFGSNQAPRQASANTGPEENGVVSPASDTLGLESVDRYIKVIITEE